MRTGIGWLWVVLAGCAYDSRLVPCGDLLCPAGSTCTDSHLCNNPLLPDSDDDGVMDTLDNCAAVPNAQQIDVDRDGVGDDCDNCPLLANTDQAAIGDDDGLGDACDPHPTMTGDCLVLVDSFREADQFALHWRTFRQPNDTAVVTPHDGFVEITPSASAISFAALDATAQPFLERYDVQARAESTIGSGSFSIASGLSTSAVYLCSLQNGSVVATVQSNGLTTNMISGLLSAPVGDDIAIWLSVPSTTRNTTVCRVQYGLALGVATNTVQAELTGFAGFAAQGDPVKVESLALISWQPGTTCPMPIIR